MVSIKIPFLDLAKVADSGQAFRIKVIDDSHIELVAYGRYLQVAKTGKDTFAFSCTGDEFNTIWKTYFDLDRDYQKIVKSIDKNDDYKAIKEKSDAFKSDRYYAINVCNDATVEFRCFKGTLKYTTFVATLQFVATMTRYCQQITTADVESVQWEDIFANTEYPELREYMVSRGLL